MAEPTTAVVNVPNHTTVNMREKPSISSALVERVPDGETVTVEQKQADWSRCSWRRWSGWIMNVYLVFDTDSDADDNQAADPEPGSYDKGEVVEVRRTWLEQLLYDVGEMLDRREG